MFILISDMIFVEIFSETGEKSYKQETEGFDLLSLGETTGILRVFL